MTQLLLRWFVKNPENTADPQVREGYGKLASLTGIAVNLLLAAAKLLMGLLSGSVAIMADAVNNLSDAAGSVVTYVTVRLSNKPVDPDHPFGHGRMEYLGSLTVGVLIVAMGVSLLRDGITGIFHPETPSFSLVVVGVLVLSILGKLWLYFFYRKLGGAVNNSTLLAAAKDSLGDVLSTGAVLLSVLLNMVLGNLVEGWPLDGIMGVLVSLIVLKAGYEVCHDTVDSLLGSRPDPEKVQAVRELLLSHEGILGIHDLVLHDYGPGRCFASVHAEVDALANVLKVHEMIDDAEREIGEKLKMPICIHMDPVVSGDPEADRLRGLFAAFLAQKDLTLHDFRRVPGEGHTNLVFDVLLPAGYKGKKDLLEELKSYAASLDETFRLVVEFDTDYAGE